MKTTQDAVIEFKGEFPVTLIDYVGWTYSWYLDSPSDAFKFKGKFVCTFLDFRDLVVELSHHAGEDLFNEYVKADKKPAGKESKVDYTSEEFWKDAPEGATHYYPEVNCFYDFSNPDCGFVFNEVKERCGDVCNFVGCLVLKPKSQPIYTKTMQDEFINGQEVFIAQINTLSGVVSKRYYIKEYWCGSGFQAELAELGLLFNSKEDAEAKCREIIGLPPIKSDKEKAIDDIYNDIYADKSINDMVRDGHDDGLIERVLNVAYDVWSGNNE